MNVAQLRASNRMRRAKNVNEVTSALTLKNGDYFTETSNLKRKSSAIVSPIGTKYNICWYHKCLYENSGEAPDNLVSTISSSSAANQDSVISSKEQKTSDCTEEEGHQTPYRSIFTDIGAQAKSISPVGEE